MHLIVYSSQLTQSDRSRTAMLEDIVSVSQRNNVGYGISGVLLFENGYFLQAIEGEEDVLRQLLTQIRSDRRHHQFVVHCDRPIEQRTFAAWAMESFALDRPDLFDTEMISLVHRIYDRSFDISGAQLIEFIKLIIDRTDTFGIQFGAVGMGGAQTLYKPPDGRQ